MFNMNKSSLMTRTIPKSKLPRSFIQGELDVISPISRYVFDDYQNKFF